MKGILLTSAIAAVLVAGLLALQPAYSQFQGGGVDHPGEWHVGEGLKQGDFYSYRMCFEAYEECKPFEMDFWIERSVREGSEEKWIAPTVVYDGKDVIKGYMNLSKVALQPTGGSEELRQYRGAFKASIVWLSAFASVGEPKMFSAISWGKIGNIGGEQIVPVLILPDGLPVEAGHYEEVIQIGWRTGGYTSKVYVVDDFPFPIQAATFQHVSEGIPPPEYEFELLSYREGVTEDPFAGIESTVDLTAETCPVIRGLDPSVKKTTENAKYLLNVFYAPERPVNGCPMTWQINFLNKFDPTEFHNQVQYDLLVDNDEGVRSIAADKGKPFLFSPSGLAKFNMDVEEGPGTVSYTIFVYGLSPKNIVPGEDEHDFLRIEIPVVAGEGSEPEAPSIPSWIKGTVGLWVDGVTDDATFLGAMQFLVQEGVIVVPPTEAGSSQSSDVPAWIQGTSKLWVDGVTDDATFLGAIQFLIHEGVIVV